jgi:predicted CXXCH cytochrome family protein
MKTRSGTMKRLLFIAMGTALMVPFGAGAAMADAGPHVSTAGVAGTTYGVASAGAERCAGCHRAHTAKDSYLLKDAQPALCYSCHQSGAMGSSTDVANGKDADTGAALRGGGFNFALINSAGALKTLGAVPLPDPITGVTPRQSHSATIPVLGAGVATTSKHQIDGVASGTMWGNGAISAAITDTGKAGVTLECGSCHDPHGNGNYRILKPVPNDSGATAPVVVPDAVAKVYTTADYWKVTDPNVPKQNVGTATAPDMTDGYIANASQWCSQCHTRYLAGSGSWGTPNTSAAGVVDANFTYRHRSDSTTKGGVERPNCIQCHVSHGSNASMIGYAAGVTTPNGTPAQPDGAPADSRLLRVDNRGTCVMCHNV